MNYESHIKQGTENPYDDYDEERLLLRGIGTVENLSVFRLFSFACHQVKTESHPEDKEVVHDDKICKVNK